MQWQRHCCVLAHGWSPPASLQDALGPSLVEPAAARKAEDQQICMPSLVKEIDCRRVGVFLDQVTCKETGDDRMPRTWVVNSPKEEKVTGDCSEADNETSTSSLVNSGATRRQVWHQGMTIGGGGTMPVASLI